MDLFDLLNALCNLLIIILVLALIVLYAEIEEYPKRSRAFFCFYLFSLVIAIGMAYLNYMLQKVVSSSLRSLFCLIFTCFACFVLKEFGNFFDRIVFRYRYYLLPSKRYIGLRLYILNAFPPIAVLVVMIALYLLKQLKSTSLLSDIKHYRMLRNLLSNLGQLADAVVILDIVLSVILCVGSYIVMPPLEAKLSLDLSKATGLYSLIYCLVLVVFTLKPDISSIAKKKVPH